MKINNNFWPHGIIVTFILFFSGIVAVIAIAVTHREYLVNDNYYDQEIGYQGQIDSAARGRASGATITYDATTAHVIIGIPGVQPAQNCSGKIQFYRPSAPSLDREFPLTSLTDGAQIIDTSKLTAGLWKVEVAWKTGGQDYYVDQKIVIAEK
ncbi:MAG: FixH family protein [Verrucomicrobiota bacterium]